ncbi:hypothetical protein DM02DRAFT_177910 [Periconia macrospinosa]|uniref:BZIP domain-containing protein n=1 Tax=Periconia macrospinosa TaxID=97972 RepID=A0A2V1E1M1_9PLEO|nr:hypothetical protein DM02DRAFT_177910 [Periconia macrospinosa]
MAPRTRPDDDDWRHVEDAKKRKQIQDRLAQRARRQRLREAKTNAKPQKHQDETPTRDETQEQQHHLHLQQPLPDVSRDFTSTLVDMPCIAEGDLDMMPNSLDIAECHFSQSALGGMNLYNSSGSTPESNDSNESQHLLPQTTASASIWSDPFSRTSETSIPSIVCSINRQPGFPLTVHGALYINGNLLGLKCGTVVPAKSTPCRADVPLPLQPTITQLTVLHSRWIDRFPFPKMRDNIITLGSVVDDEELLKDIVLMPSFEITPGKLPWDPKAWTMQKPFADKWGYLFLQ